MEKYLEVLGKLNFGDDWFPLYKVYYNTDDEIDKAKAECIRYIREYRANHKRAEFKIKDQNGKIID